MGEIKGKTLFMVTSPRTPVKMIPEIELLVKNFTGQKWDKDSQRRFMEILAKNSNFQGKGEKDPGFSARDRINRGPKALGFVALSPSIVLTPAGKVWTSSSQKEEILLRQLLKFQLPSPYHRPTQNAARFNVKPYLEIFRLIRHFGSLKFDELQIFGLQLVDYHLFDAIVEKIECFRQEKAKNSGSYKNFMKAYLEKELREIYKEEIALGKTETRESKDKSTNNFLNIKAKNLRDYADACVRYLRATGMVNVSQIGKSLSIAPDRISDVDYFLTTVDRKPRDFNEEQSYIDYLGNERQPVLLTDNRELLLGKLTTEFPDISINDEAPLDSLKTQWEKLRKKRTERILSKQIEELKDYHQFDDVQNTFTQIAKDQFYDTPLMLEWNVWRAMTLLDRGEVKANLKFDDFGQPMSTALGNVPDIVCDYGEFALCVEVTMASGAKQYEMEGEPVSRHLANWKKTIKKPTYCLFIAPKINDNVIAHFYGLQKLNIEYDGGKSTIIPLTIDVFRKMVEDSYKASYKPEPEQIQRFFEMSQYFAETCSSERQWYVAVTEMALDWLNIPSLPL
ncbi:MAG: AlwI family type II restriction endonuclease [Planctomycetia bacterium]|nr:AlwI family type II restriction endonuclease [Planctomycetia bacterium]